MSLWDDFVNWTNRGVDKTAPPAVETLGAGENATPEDYGNQPAYMPGDYGEPPTAQPGDTPDWLPKAINAIGYVAIAILIFLGAYIFLDTVNLATSLTPRRNN